MFIDPPGADNALGFSNLPVGAANILDDSSSTGVNLSGNWTTQTTGGFDGEFAQSDASGSDVATYTFTGLTPGSFQQIAITWPATTGAYQNAVSVLDGGHVINTFTIDQTQNPSDPNDPSSTWQSLGTFYVTGTTLQVQIAQTSGYYGVSIAVADAVRLQQIVGNAAADDNFHVMPSSPTIDAGDPASVSFNEPQPNGVRVNLGFDGNTSAAATSPQQLIQVLSPGGFGKLVDGQQVNLQWRSDGLTPSQPVLFINTGNGPAVGAFLSNSYQTSAYSYDNGSISGPIDLSGVDDPAPTAVYQSYSSASYGAGSTLSYNLPVPDGTYTIRLDFADPNDSAEGQRTFDIQLQGSTVASAYDIYQAAGDLDNKATQLTYTFTVTGGQGINLNLVNDTNTPAILSGIELTRSNPEGTANPAVDLAYSTDGGMTWMPIGSGVSMDSFGSGNYSWTIPADAPTGDNYLVRVTSDQAATVSGTSLPFTVANSGHLYYVNDSSTSGDVFTTAPGNNANDGKTASTPMASLAALLSAYTMHPGDIIYVDTGTYNGVRNIVLGPDDSGITIEGAAPAAPYSAAVTPTTATMSLSSTAPPTSPSPMSE